MNLTRRRLLVAGDARDDGRVRPRHRHADLGTGAQHRHARGIAFLVWLGLLFFSDLFPLGAMIPGKVGAEVTVGIARVASL